MDRYRMLPSYRFYDVEGTSPLTLDKSVGKPLRDYKIYGNSVQDGTPSPDNPVEVQSVGDKSKNLFNEKLLLNHGSIEKTEEGYLAKQYPVVFHTAQGYDSARAIIDSLKATIKPNVAYTLSRKASNCRSTTNDGAIQIRGNDNTEVFASVYLGEGVKSTTFSLTQEQIDNITSMYIYGNYSTVPVLFEYIQLEEGETATEYEPYGYKIPIEVDGKNLFDVKAVDGVYNSNGTINSGGGSMSEDGILTINRSLHGGAIYVPFGTNYLKAGSYTISTLVYATKTNTIKLGIILKDETSIGTSKTVVNNEWVYIFTKINIEEDTEILGLQIQGTSSKDYNNQGTLFKNIQIEYGEIATEYEPYKEPIKTNIYLDEPLYKIGDYADYIDFKNGKVVRNIFEYTFVGNEFIATPWADLGTTITCHSNTLIDGKLPTEVRGFSEKGVFDGGGINLNDTERCMFAYSSGIKRSVFYARILKSRCADPDNPTADDFNKIYTAGTKVYGVRETPIEQPIDLPPILPHKGTNVISVGTAIQPSNMQIQYYK